MQTKDKTITVLQASNWPQCDSQVRFAIAAKQKSVFEGNKVQLQRIIGGLRAITSGTCAKLAAIEVIGFYKSEAVYKAVVKKSEGWRLVPVKRTPQDSADAVYDNQRFLDLLSQSSGAKEPKTRTLGTQDPKAPIPSINPPIIGSTDQSKTAENWRDQYAYKKLTRNMEQTLGLPLELIAERCFQAQSEDLDRISPATQDLLYRVCRAVGYASGNLDLGKNAEDRISQSP